MRDTPCVEQVRQNHFRIPVSDQVKVNGAGPVEDQRLDECGQDSWSLKTRAGDGYVNGAAEVRFLG